MASAEQVKELRARTGAGIMECKKAITESGGDLEAAIDFLRKQGTVKAAKKADRATSEGSIGVASADAADKAAIVEVNCETDFVARTDDFKNFVSDLAKHVLAVDAKDMDELMASPMASQDNKPVSEALEAIIAKVGENMGIARFQVVLCDNNEKIGSYIHAGSQIAVLLKVAGEKIPQDSIREIAMHIAAMHPFYVNEAEVPSDAADRERSVLREAPDLAGKPPEVIDKMIAGRFRKFLSQVCLLDQAFIKDPQGKQSVGQFVKSLDPEGNIPMFVRYQVGGQS